MSLELEGAPQPRALLLTFRWRLTYDTHAQVEVSQVHVLDDHRNTVAIACGAWWRFLHSRPERERLAMLLLDVRVDAPPEPEVEA